VYKLAQSVRKLYPDVRDDYLFELEVRDGLSDMPNCYCSNIDYVGRCESSRNQYIVLLMHVAIRLMTLPKPPALRRFSVTLHMTTASFTHPFGNAQYPLALH